MKPVRLVRALGASVVVLASACTQPSHNSVPVFGPNVNRATPPPAISGGTLAISHDGTTALASDPDNDAIFVVDLAARRVRSRIALAAGDEPFRAVEDAAGRMFVVLRGAGQVATVDLATGALTARRAVCHTPRGIAYQPTTDLLYIACESGELITLAAAGGPVVRNITLPQEDLRDVVVTRAGLLISTFRTPGLIHVLDDGTVDATGAPSELALPDPGVPDSTGGTSVRRFTPTVAWRTISTPGGGALMLHQRALSSVVAPPASDATTSSSDSSGYGSSRSPSGSMQQCSATAVHTAVSEFDSTAVAINPVDTIVPTATLPVDLARASDGRLAIVAAANASIPRLPEVLIIAPGGLGTACVFPATTMRPAQGQATSVAFDSYGGLVVQTRSPTSLAFADGGALVLDATPVRDTGHEIFHANSGGFIACASCHPEGRDDGHTWFFEEQQPRRTMSLRGGLLQSAPFHWRGDLRDMNAVMAETFVQRMDGPPTTAEQSVAVGRWLDALPLPTAPAPADSAAVDRGHVLFDDPSVGCASCHGGPLHTNNATVDVGTHDGAYQVPPLRGLRWRAPYMHDGCATTLGHRFDSPSCGGWQHGNTSTLTPDQVGDLVAYLRTL